MRVDLLPHNQVAYEKIKSAIAYGKKKIAISHATGTGKSYLIAKLFEDYSNDKKLVLVPSTYISDQIQKLFEKYSIQNADIILYQKLIKMDDVDIATMDYGMIALDEYHHDTSKVWGEKVRKLIDTHPESIIFGTSATPIRSDGINTIDELFEGNCASGLSLSESIAKKIVPLPKYVGALYTLDDELEKLRKKVESATNTSEEKREFYKKINTMRSQIEKSYGMPIILNKHVKNKEGKYIIFCKKKKHLREIKDTVIGWFKTAGFKDINAYEVYSDYENKDAEYKAFCEDTSHNLKLLFCVNMLNEGLHLENVSGVLLLRPTRSMIVFLQQIGRTIEANNANTPVVIDAVNNFSSVGQSMKLFKEIKDAIEREKESDPNFDDSGFEDIHTFLVLENIIEIKEMFKEIEERLGGREWTEEEIDILRKYYPIEGVKVRKRLCGRTKESIFTIVYKLGINAPNVKWTKEEIDILKKYYPIYGINTDQFLPNRPISSIRDKANELGIYVEKPGIFSRNEDATIKKYYPTEGSNVYKRLNNKTKKQCRSRAKILGVSFINNSIWTKEEDDIIKECYADDSGAVYEKLKNKSKSQIMSRACQLKVRKKTLNWSENEDAIIKKYYQFEGTNVYQRLNGRSKNACMIRARFLGVSIKKNGIPWDDKDYKILREYYPQIGTRVSGMLNRSKGSCATMAHKMGIKYYGQ